MNEGEASVKIYKCPKCVRKFTRKGLGVHFTKIHRLKLEDMYLEEEINQAEVKVEKLVIERASILMVYRYTKTTEYNRFN